MGFGGIMMAGEVLKKIDQPYFPRTRDEAMQSFVGEDFGFYNNCRNAGIDVWCDTDLHYSHMVSTAVNVNRKPTCASWETLEAFGERPKIVKEDVVPPVIGSVGSVGRYLPMSRPVLKTSIVRTAVSR